MTIFVGGKQKRVRRDRYSPLLVDGVPVEEFIRANADPIWLQQNEVWEELHELWEPPSPHEDTLEDGMSSASMDELFDLPDRESNSA